MKAFRRIIAFVICAVMLAGIVPFAFDPDGVKAAEVQYVDGLPVVYVSQSGDDTADGFSEETAVKTLEVASGILATIGKGGIIRVVGSSTYKPAASQDVLAAGGTIYIEGTEGGPSVQVQGALLIHEDLVLRNIDFASTSSPKAFFMNWNDLTVESSCTDAGNYKLNVVAGAQGSNEDQVSANATNVSGIDQVIELNALHWYEIHGGSAQTGSVSKPISVSKDASNNCSGRTVIKISGTAHASFVDLATDATLRTDLIYGISGKFSISNCVLTDSTKEVGTPDSSVVQIFGHFTDTEDDTTGSEKYINVVNASAFGDAVSTGTKDYNGITGVRVSYTTGTDFAAWSESAGVEEFGVLIADAANARKIRNVSGTNQYGIGRSLCYDATHNNYEYAGGETAVTFRGVLQYANENGDDLLESFKATKFAAAPYAVVKGADVGGKYTVIGNVTTFSYNETVANQGN